MNGEKESKKLDGWCARSQTNKLTLILSTKSQIHKAEPSQDAILSSKAKCLYISYS